MQEAVVLVGGLGTRLRPLTLTTPKPMLPVAGVPFIAHQCAKLQAAGVDHVVLATSYRPEIFADYLGDGASLGIRITYVHEREALGTGGAIRNASAALESGANDPVVILNGDVLSGHDLRGQVELHRKTEAAVTLHLVEVADARAYGCVPTDADGRVTAFLEKMPDPVTNWINAGAYVFRRSVIDAIPAGQVISVERDTFPNLLLAASDIRAWQESAYWIDVGTPEAFVRCSADVVLGVAPSNAASPAGSARIGDAMVLLGAEMANDVRLSGGTTIGAGARVGTGTDVDESVVMDAAVVGSSTRVRRSVIGKGAVIGDGCVLDGCVLADGVVVADGTELPPGTRVELAVDIAGTSNKPLSDPAVTDTAASGT